MLPRKKKELDPDAVYTDILSIKYEFKKELDLPQPEIEDRVKSQKCDFRCCSRCENVKLVRLYDITIHKDHGYFSLCDKAIDKTLKSGITVFVQTTGQSPVDLEKLTFQKRNPDGTWTTLK